MSKYIKTWGCSFVIAASIAIPAFFAACEKIDGEIPKDSGPLMLSTHTDVPQTRATSEGTWAGTETVKVNISGTEYDFMAATDGTLTCASRYWNDYTSVDAYAWYPANYTFPSNQSTGIQSADFIHANKVTGITQSNYSTTKKLTFKHKTAKVTATLAASTSVPNISGATVTLYGYTTANVNTETGELSGSGGSNAINPCKNGNTCTALLIPKSYTDENVLKVTLGDKDYFWKPALLNLEEGKAYTFSITVETRGLTVAVTNNNATWDLGSTSEVAAIGVALISKGTFTMGSPATERYRGLDETQHSVTLTEDFYMSKYEITNAQYAAFLNANSIGSNGQGNLTGYGAQTYILDCTQNGRSIWGVTWINNKWVPYSGKDNFPVIYVTWYGAMAFAEWVGGMLPTEAQWEYACRAGTTTTYSYGNTVSGAYMWYSGNSDSATHAVGTKFPNPWGLYDMHGNVYEWCKDWYGDYDNGFVTNPMGPSTGDKRVLRGCSWRSRSEFGRSAYRTKDPPDFADFIGIRVIFSL